MALAFSDLKTEVFNRGFDSLNDGGTGASRVARWVNDAMHEIDEIERWPYRAATATGAAPLTVSDLGDVEAVYDSTNGARLAPIDRGALVQGDADLAATGTPTVFYLVGNVVTVWPVAAVSLSVTYWKVGPDLSGNSDTPLMPDRFRMAIVNYAVASALEDKSNYQEAAVARASGDRLVERMRESYVLQAGGARQAVFGYSEDW